MTFWNYFSGTVISPYKTFNCLLADPRQLVHGIKAMLLIGALYTLTVIGLAVVRADITVPALIVIPADEYYFWEIFFALPVFMIGWVLAAGLVQLLSKPFKATGMFDGTLAVLAFALTIPSFVTWIPETVGTILFLLGVMTQKEWLEMTARPGFWQVFATAYQLVALAWYLVLVPIAVSAAYKLRWWQAAIVGILALAVFGSLMFIFIR